MRRSLAPSQQAVVAKRAGVPLPVGTTGVQPRAKRDRRRGSDSGSEDESDAELPDRLPLADLAGNGGSGMATPTGNASLQAHEARIFSLLHRPFKVPIPGYSGEAGKRGLGVRKAVLRGPLHSPDEDDAIVLYRPPPLSVADQSNPDIRNKHPVAVVVDPIVGCKLRPHQIEGVQFLYDCVTGTKIPGYFGGIMADGMGLGKTLQNVTLVWTLLRQSPECKPMVTKAVIVCPSSLVKNWSNEFHKWVGEGVRTLPIDTGTSEEIDAKLAMFMNNKGRGSSQVLIISYETLRGHAHALKGEIGIVICDEGHRLKNSENQTYRALIELNTKRRVILTGTPVQNELLEYYALVQFVNPGLLGSANEFRKRFELPILRSRDSLATDKDQALGQERLAEMVELVNRCLIRRTSDLLSKYLPPKIETVVCCRLTETQKRMYKHLISGKAVSDSCGGSLASSLAFITHLKKLCNHPELVYERAVAEEPGFEDLLELFPAGYSPKAWRPELSGKMMVIDTMLAILKARTDEKIVLISNYTQTLDLLEKLCRVRKYRFVRLDGSMTIKKRQKVVDSFNDPHSGDFIFMLSSKAGGCGINLIGASRLILTDPDWNPANDAQALARIWRDGQQRICYVYRLVATGTIEEKILQRQAHKTALSECVIDEAEDVERHFSLAEMRDLFKLNEVTTSDMHDQFHCRKCSRDGTYSLSRPGQCTVKGILNDFSQWDHFPQIKFLKDNVLREAAGDMVTFVFRAQSHEVGQRVSDAEASLVKKEDEGEEAEAAEAEESDQDDEGDRSG